jgi:N-acetylmuramoyl-L-alanine amidase
MWNPADVATLRNPVSRYPVSEQMTPEDFELMAHIVAIEARGEPFDGQVAVAEVIFNRTLRDDYPETVEGVIFDRHYGIQFNSILYLDDPAAYPTDTQRRAVVRALYGPHSLPMDVIFFSTGGGCGRYYKTIGNHVFSRG